MSPPIVAFLTDYGLADDFVGVCHAVMLRARPELRILDLTHAVPRQDVAAGARTLARALPYLPADAVILAVVDPGVGGARRPLAVRCADGRRLVGPDNGLLWPAAEAAGGVRAAVDLARSPWRVTPVSATFHGRDLFAPAAAALAGGERLERGGDPVDPAELQRLELSRARVAPGVIEAHVVAVDGFGNLELDAAGAELVAAGLADHATLAAGGAVARVVRTFADVAAGELLIHEDAHGALALAVNRGSAADRLGLRAGAPLVIGPG